MKIWKNFKAKFHNSVTHSTTVVNSATVVQRYKLKLSIQPV